MTKPQKKGPQTVELKADKRQVVGHKVKHLRAEGQLPAVIYGKGQESISLQVPSQDFVQVLKDAGESTLVYLKVGSETYPTIIHDVARNPLTGQPIHADFYRVRLDEAIRADVPVVFIGVSPAVKELGGIFVRNVNELEVEALPTNMPHEIEVDISNLKNFGDQILLKDIVLKDAKLTGGEDEIVATVQEPKSQEELEAELAEPTTDVSAVEEAKPEKEEKADEEAEETVAAETAETKKE